MGWFNSESETAGYYDQYQSTQEHHKAKLSHEVIAGAASYEAAKAYEEHCAQNGHPDSHAKAKEILAGLAGAFIDREVESKGLDWVDRQRAKQHAVDHIDENVTVNTYNTYYDN